MHLEYSTELPTRPGYYWCWGICNEPVLISVDPRHDGRMAGVTFWGSRSLLTNRSWNNTRWTGPIEPPPIPDQEAGR